MRRPSASSWRHGWQCRRSLCNVDAFSLLAAIPPLEEVCQVAKRALLSVAAVLAVLGTRTHR